jgi:hypothetical protein
MAILGLLNSEQFQSERFKNVRRSVFYFYPNGAAPMTGLLSMLKEEDTDDPEYNWWEKRLSKQSSLTVANTTGAFANTSNVDLSNPFTLAADALFRLAVADATMFRVGHMVQVTVGSVKIQANVTNIFSSTTPNRIELRPIAAVPSTVNTVATVGLEVLVIGSAFRQGIVDNSSAIYNKPINPSNFAQIFRTPFSITGTALKTGVKYDESGAYKDLAKESSVYHMIEMEKAFLFGGKSSSVDASTGLPTYTTGGILWFLEQWEAAASVYRGASSSALTNDADDDKRIITNSTGAIDEKTYDAYLERVFRVTNNISNEKLVFCGSGFLNTINQLYKSKSCLTTDLPMTDTYGMNVVKHTTPFGTIYYKSHPLFSQNDTLRYNAMFLDVQNMKYRYMQGRDTELLKNRQPNDADYRKDEYLTEAGMELLFPESFMYLQNVRSYNP